MVVYVGMATPLTTRQFDHLYKQLNKAQREAVDTVEGPVMVVAGPGTGKTQILTLRIANILRVTDADASAILALTFTEAGVAAMRKRLVGIIGESGYKVALHTFHGFCNDIITRYPDEFPRIIGSEPITDVEQITLLRRIITESELPHLKPFSNNFYFLVPIKSTISELKREGVRAQQLREKLARRTTEIESADDLHHTSGAHKGKMKARYQDELKRVARGFELADIYEAYEAALREHKWYDYEDMILEVLHELRENESLLRRLQEQHQYILADEHQDANGAQNSILELLSNFHESPNLFIVGDEKQAIFRFQGASLENFNYFKTLYPDARLITLDTNYRSGQSILDSAHSLMEGATLYNAPLTSQAGGVTSSVHLATFGSVEAERLFVARRVRTLIEEGVEPREIAILYRTNADAGPLSSVLESERVPYQVESNQNALADSDIRKLLIVLYAVAEFGSSSRLVPAMHVPFLGLSPTSVYRILRYARRERVNVFDVCTDKKLLKKAAVDVREVTTFVSTLEQLTEHAREESVPTFFNRLVRDSGFLTYVLNSRRAGELVEKLRSLSATITALAARDVDYTLSTLVEHLQLLEEYRVPISQGTATADRSGSVRLMTAHKSKGLEFDHVFIIGARDKHWGNRRESDMFHLPDVGSIRGDNDDERRLFYVALTRARISVTVSYSTNDAEGRTFLPSIFLSEIAPDLIEHVDTRTFEHGLSAHDLFPQEDRAQSTIHDKEYLNALFRQFGLSVTALNNYLACPWQYFYRNLVRIPEPPSKHLAFGNAVHGALQYFFEHGTQRSLTLLLREFERVLGKQPLTTTEHAEALTRGRETLTLWHEHYKGTWSHHSKNEYEIKTHLDGTLLRGTLDKLELQDGHDVVVVDYKTGTPKSRNEILGNTKNSNGDYHRQLVFYQLLLNLHNEEVRRTGKGREYVMTAGELDFIQADARGAFHKERFLIEEHEVNDLKETIARVSQEIIDLTFWDTRCDAHRHGTCTYCTLRDLMR